ncbi:MAG: hypothetical protein Fur0024_4160 [Patescibacteria group bacterium]
MNLEKIENIKKDGSTESFYLSFLLFLDYFYLEVQKILGLKISFKFLQKFFKKENLDFGKVYSAELLAKRIKLAENVNISEIEESKNDLLEFLKNFQNLKNNKIAWIKKKFSIWFFAGKGKIIYKTLVFGGIFILGVVPFFTHTETGNFLINLIVNISDSIWKGIYFVLVGISIIFISVIVVIFWLEKKSKK